MFCLLQPLWRGGGDGVGGDSDITHHFQQHENIFLAVLANLCVSYIMTSQNEEAEELMRKIEKVWLILKNI